MNIRPAIFLFILVATAVTVIGGQIPSTEYALEKLKTDMRDHTITKMKVIFVRYEVSTRVTITPESLEVNASHGAGFIKILDMDNDMRGSLLTALEKTRIGPLNDRPDLRWGAIFYNSNGQQSHSLYILGKAIDRTGGGRIDLSGTRGIIDGNLATFNGVLFEWFETTFRDSMGVQQQKSR